MTIDTTPSTVATNALQSIPFSAMIGGPLDAAIKAQAMAAQTSWEFIQNVGLTKDPQTGETKAVSVTFQFQKDGQMINLVVPLLAIVPIPYIAIETITIDFTAKIDASASTFSEQSSESEASAKGSLDVSVGWGPFSAKMHMEGGYSSKSSSKATSESKYSVEYTLNIHVEAGQDSMPAGLATVLNILNNAITQGNPKGTFEVSPGKGSVQLGAENPLQVSLKARDSQDLAIASAATFEFKDTSTKLTGAKLAIVTGSANGTANTDTKVAIDPSAQGLAAVTLNLPSTITLTDPASATITVTQGSNTVDVPVTVYPAKA